MMVIQIVLLAARSRAKLTHIILLMTPHWLLLEYFHQSCSLHRVTTFIIGDRVHDEDPPNIIVTIHRYNPLCSLHAFYRQLRTTCELCQ